MLILIMGLNDRKPTPDEVDEAMSSLAMDAEASAGVAECAVDELNVDSKQHASAARNHAAAAAGYAKLINRALFVEACEGLAAAARCHAHAARLHSAASRMDQAAKDTAHMSHAERMYKQYTAVCRIASMASACGALADRAVEDCDVERIETQALEAAALELEVSSKYPGSML